MSENSARTSSKKSDFPKTRKAVAVIKVSPNVDCGRYPIKRVVGDTLKIQANILKPGHDQIYSVVYHRMQGVVEWQIAPMTYDYNEDKWNADFLLDSTGTHEYFIEAWTDRLATLLSGVEKWVQAGEDVSADLEEIKELLKNVQSRAKGDEVDVISRAVNQIGGNNSNEVVEVLKDPLLSAIVNRRILKQDAGSSQVFRVAVDVSDCPRTSWVLWFDFSSIVCPSPIRGADRVDWRKVDRVKPHLLNVVQSFLAICKGRAFSLYGSLRAMKHQRRARRGKSRSGNS